MSTADAPQRIEVGQWWRAKYADQQGHHRVAKVVAVRPGTVVLLGTYRRAITTDRLLKHYTLAEDA